MVKKTGMVPTLSNLYFSKPKAPSFRQERRLFFPILIMKQLGFRVVNVSKVTKLLSVVEGQER